MLRSLYRRWTVRPDMCQGQLLRSVSLFVMNPVLRSVSPSPVTLRTSCESYSRLWNTSMTLVSFIAVRNTSHPSLFPVPHPQYQIFRPQAWKLALPNTSWRCRYHGCRFRPEQSNGWSQAHSVDWDLRHSRCTFRPLSPNAVKFREFLI